MNNERSWARMGRGLTGVVMLSVLSAACAKKDEAPASTATLATATAPVAASASPAFATSTAESEGGEMAKDRGGNKGDAMNKPAPGRRGPLAIGQAAGAGLPADAQEDGKKKMEAKPSSPVAMPQPAATMGPSEARKVDKDDVAIDPNGRFATTYRPGGGHLSSFEAAVARNVVPAAERELVSDVGARYAADVPAPTGKTMLLSPELERAKLAPGGGNFHTRLTLRSTAKAAAERPHLSVHLVLDVSGSMAGEAIDNARKAAQALVDKLAPTDDFSLVTFSSEAKVTIPDGPVGARREQLKKTIAEIKEGGGTNIGDGLILGYQQARTKSIPADAVKVVLLLSDGHVNAGILDKGQLSKLALDAFQDGVQTSAFGLGGEYDGPLMSAIAGDGAGGYYYLRESDQIAPALATELDKRLDPVATAVEVRVRLKKGVELLHVYGSQRLNTAEAARVRAQEVAIDAQEQQKNKIKSDRQTDQEGGMRFFLPAFARDDSHALLLKLRVSEGVGSKPIALVELKYKDRVTRKNVSEEIVLNADYAGSDAESFTTTSASVARTVQGFAAGETLAEAANLVNRGDRQGATALLSEREGILRNAAASLSEPLFLKDAERMSRLRSHAQGSSGMGDPLVLAMLLETASHVHLR